MTQKTYFIGDVHGCYDELVELLAYMSPDSLDRVIFLGDMINKGPKSKEVIALIRKNGYEALIGNHETYYLNGGALPGKMLSDEEYVFIENLPYYIDDPKFLAVHAGIAPGVDIVAQENSVLANIRTWDQEENRMGHDADPAWHDLYSGNKVIMYGHWARQGLRKQCNSIGLDTGCCFGGHLTGYCLETDELWQVRARHLYVPMDGSPHFTTPEAKK